MHIYRNWTTERFIVKGPSGIMLAFDPAPFGFDVRVSEHEHDYIAVTRQLFSNVHLPKRDAMANTRWIVPRPIAEQQAVGGRPEFVYLGEADELSAAEKQDVPPEFADAAVYNRIIIPAAYYRFV